MILEKSAVKIMAGARRKEALRHKPEAREFH
jgi:hypothetical protein